MDSAVSEDARRATAPAEDQVIVVDGVWKGYRPQTHQMSLRHEAMKLLRQPLRRGSEQPEEPFWALRDITFTICRGESVALVGRNGSGKTTCLRVLAGITRPTRGHARVHGRFAALIGLGAGFNFERTGRENIYLNAAIQGVPPREVTRFLHDIIAFSELDEFIDVPVKRYSSGMITRLGFSIAAHIFPDIVFIDEVLAVGDIAFQEKCIDRMLAMKREGRTLLFVSHDPDLVRLLCARSIWLHHGEMQCDGETDQVLKQYYARLEAEGATAST